MSDGFLMECAIAAVAGALVGILAATALAAFGGGL